MTAGHVYALRRCSKERANGVVIAERRFLLEILNIKEWAIRPPSKG